MAETATETHQAQKRHRCDWCWQFVEVGLSIHFGGGYTPGMTEGFLMAVSWGMVLGIIYLTPKGTMNMVWIIALILIALSPLITIAFPSLR